MRTLNLLLTIALPAAWCAFVFYSFVEASGK
jgi:hypothetical protein